MSQVTSSIETLLKKLEQSLNKANELDWYLVNQNTVKNNN